MVLVSRPGTTAQMGHSLVAHPSDRKLAALVGDGTFGRWACLDMVVRGLVFVCPAPPHRYFSFCVKVVLIFVGMVDFGCGLNWKETEGR